MSIKDFEKFLAKQQLPEEERPIDWQLQRKEWLDFLDGLYSEIEEYLSGYLAGGKVSIDYDEITLSEENIGTYAARRMTIRLGENRIILTPIGTVLIGTKGRVDMTGPRGTKRFILADKDSTGMKVTVRFHDPNKPFVEEKPKPINWEWKIVSSSSRPSYNKLSQEGFLDSLVEISNG